MKKLTAAIVIILFFSFSINFVYASFLSSAISRIIPSAAVAGAAGSKIVPALFTGTTTAGTVASWVSLVIPGTALAKIAGAVITVAGAIAAETLFNIAAEWFQANKIGMNGTDLTIDNNYLLPPGGDYNTYYGHTPGTDGGTNYGMGYFSTSTLAYAACLASPNGTSACYSSNTQGPVNSFHRDTLVIIPTPYSSHYDHWFFYFYNSGPPGVLSPHTDPLTNSQFQDKLAAAIASGNDAAAVVAQTALDIAANSLDIPDHPINKNPAAKAAIAAALLASLSVQQQAALEAGATGFPGDGTVPAVTNPDALTAAQITAAIQIALTGQKLSADQIAAATAAVLAGQGQTQAQTQAAITAALTGAGVTPAAAAAAAVIAAAQLAATQQIAINTAAIAEKAAEPAVGAYTGGNVIGLSAWVTPAVGDFSALFRNFLTDMRNTPLFSLPGLLSSSVPSGGECTLSIDLSPRFGGSHSFSMCNWATGLSAVKAALLCVASIFAIGIVAKGGGG
jgi:hypothetical protein